MMKKKMNIMDFEPTKMTPARAIPSPMLGFPEYGLPIVYFMRECDDKWEEGFVDSINESHGGSVVIAHQQREVYARKPLHKYDVAKVWFDDCQLFPSSDELEDAWTKLQIKLDMEKDELSNGCTGFDADVFKECNLCNHIAEIWQYDARDLDTWGKIIAHSEDELSLEAAAWLFNRLFPTEQNPYQSMDGFLEAIA